MSNFLNFSFNNVYLKTIVFGLLCAPVTALLISILYKKVRSKYPITVNCWFCNSYASVPYTQSNSWVCPSCQQYNGFTKDGDYNKPIAEQYDGSLNSKVYNTLKSAFSPVIKGNGLCRLCNINQQLKVQQLAFFTPIDEGSYDEEMEEFKAQLEKSYRLCAKCEASVEKTLDRQNYDILKNRLNESAHHGVGWESSMTTQKLDGLQARVYNQITPVLKWFNCTLTAVVLFLSLLKLHGTPGFSFDISAPYVDSAYLEICMDGIYRLYNNMISITALGLFTSAVMIKKKQELGLPALWAILFSLAWLQKDSLVLLLRGIAISLLVLQIPSKKKNIVKHEIQTKEHMATPPMTLEQPKTVEEPIQTENKNVILKEKKITRTAEPPKTIERELNGLSLGSSSVSSKGTNFLFEKHDFTDRIKRNPTPLLRPSKFVTNWTTNDWNETPTRSSTPSSGYSSQKYEESRPLKLTADEVVRPSKLFNDESTPRAPYYDPYWSIYQYSRTAPVYYSGPQPNFPYYRYSPSYASSSPDSTPPYMSPALQAVPIKQELSLFYQISICLNILTLSLFIYAVYTGFLSIDWQFPRFGINI